MASTGFSPGSISKNTGYSPTSSGVSNNNSGTQYGGSGSGYGSGSGGGGGGGGGSSSGPTPEQQKAAANLGGIVGWNQQTLLNAAKQADTIFDISDQQNENMRNIETIQNRRNAGNDWYTQQQKLQSVTQQLRDAGGNAYNGSALYDLWDMIARKDDMDDVETLNTLRENLNTVDNDYFNAIMATLNARNEQYMQTESNLRELMGDYAAQLNNIHPDLAAPVIDTANHTLIPPSWITTSYFDGHVRQAIEPTEQELVRPDNAASENWSRGLVTGQRNNNQSGNNSYWSRMMNGYDRRTQ